MLNLRFENFHFSLMRSLPISLKLRLSYFMLIWVLLALPEISTIINYFPAHLSFNHLIETLLFGISTGVLGYSTLFLKDITLETFIGRIFFVTFSWIILILFKMPVMVLILLHAVIAVVIYQNRFYKFEFERFKIYCKYNSSGIRL